MSLTLAGVGTECLPIAGEMGVTNGNGQRIGGVGIFELTARQQSRHHDLDLRLVRMPRTNHRFFNPIGGIFGHRHIGLGRRDQHRAAGQSKFQSGVRILIDESLLDRDLIWRKAADNVGNAFVKLQQPERD